MKTLRITLRLSDIESVSDRTSRRLLKDLAQLCRRAQVREVNAIIKSADLSRAEQQAIRDRLANKVMRVPVYYLRSVGTGSIEIAVVVSAAGVWLLQATLGETIKEAWKEAGVHRAIVDWVKNRREKSLQKIVRDEAKKSDFLQGRAITSSTSSKDGDIVITLQPSEYAVIRHPEPITEDTVVRRSEDALKALSASDDVQPEDRSSGQGD